MHCKCTRLGLWKPAAAGVPALPPPPPLVLLVLLPVAVKGGRRTAKAGANGHAPDPRIPCPRWRSGGGMMGTWTLRHSESVCPRISDHSVPPTSTPSAKEFKG